MFFGISVDLVNTINPSTWGAEAGGSLLSSRPAWSRLYWIPSQLELYGEILSQEQQKGSNPNTNCFVSPVLFGLRVHEITTEKGNMQGVEKLSHNRFGSGPDSWRNWISSSVHSRAHWASSDHLWCKPYHPCLEMHCSQVHPGLLGASSISLSRNWF